MAIKLTLDGLFRLQLKPPPSHNADVAQDSVTILYRPVGNAELELIKDSSFRRFPPRLPSQPIFYPVLNREYAEQIARDWNTRDEQSGFCGYVLRFAVLDTFLSKYQVQKVGGLAHLEYWIPADDLEEMNRNIDGLIEIVSEFTQRT